MRPFRRLYWVAVLVFFNAPAWLLAQGMPPGGTTYEYAIVVDDTENGGKVRGLKFKENAAAYTHAIPKHEVSFTLKVVPLNGSPAPSNWAWIPSPPPPSGAQFDEGLLIFLQNTGSWKCTGYAWSPGEKVATCVIEVDGAPGPIAVTTNVLVIGGPLTGLVSGSYVVTPNQSEVVPFVPKFDPESSAWHLQLFANESSIAIWEQTPQWLQISWQQPPDGPALEFDWTLPSFVHDPARPEASLPGRITAGILHLYGSAPGSSATVSCEMFATWIDMHGVEHEGSALDTTSFVHGNGVHSNKIAVHRPVEIVEGPGTFGNNLQGVSGHHSAKWHVLMVVKDQDGMGMPGVAVQERFPQGPLPGMAINPTGAYWVTRTAVVKKIHNLGKRLLRPRSTNVPGDFCTCRVV